MSDKNAKSDNQTTFFYGFYNCHFSLAKKCLNLFNPKFNAGMSIYLV